MVNEIKHSEENRTGEVLEALERLIQPEAEKIRAAGEELAAARAKVEARRQTYADMELKHGPLLRDLRRAIQMDDEPKIATLSEQLEMLERQIATGKRILGMEPDLADSPAAHAIGEGKRTIVQKATTLIQERADADGKAVVECLLQAARIWARFREDVQAVENTLTSQYHLSLPALPREPNMELAAYRGDDCRRDFARLLRSPNAAWLLEDGAGLIARAPLDDVSDPEPADGALEAEESAPPIGGTPSDQGSADSGETTKDVSPATPAQ
jgi:hypothetical protein